MKDIEVAATMLVLLTPTNKTTMPMTHLILAVTVTPMEDKMDEGSVMALTVAIKSVSLTRIFNRAATAYPGMLTGDSAAHDFT